MVGLHENYITQNVLMDIHNNPFIDYVSYEDIFIHERRNFIQAVAHATGFTEDSIPVLGRPLIRSACTQQRSNTPVASKSAARP